MGRAATLFMTLACLALLAGCDPFAHPKSMMDEYLDRVGRVLDQPVERSELPSVPPYPRRRDIRLPLPELEMGILDFLSLYGCELQQVIGEKNSSLGRVMQPGRRLDYELRFIAKARQCLPKIDDKALASDLKQAIATKTASLPIAFWNATWGSEEMERFFSRSDGPLPMDIDSTLIASLETDLNQLIRHQRSLSSPPYPDALPGISDAYQRWQARSYAGQLLQSARLLTARLHDAADVIEQRLDRRPLCIEGRSNRDAEIMRNVFFKVYAERVQPYMASVQRTRQRLLAKLSQLARSQRPIMPVAFESFYRDVLKEGFDGSIWGALDQATERHTRQWQILLEQCGMRPQA